jgi:alpha-1,4-digalacturonate transport system permease protein
MKGALNLARGKASIKSYENQQKRAAYAFILPNFIIFTTFFLIPAVYGVIYSFYKHDGWSKPKFIGWNNYKAILADPVFWKVLQQTFVYAIVSVPLVFAVSLLLAMLLTQDGIKGRGLMRASIYWPTMISTVIVGLMWRWIFGENFGIINYLIQLFGGTSVPWLTSDFFAKATVIVATVWSKAGFFMIIFIGGLESIPTSYYEAATIDGASKLRQFWNITLPLLKPTSFLVFVLSIINAFKEYPLVLTLTGGGPGDSTTYIVQYIYETGFIRFKMGFASAASMIMFVILAILTLVQFKIGRGGEV